MQITNVQADADSYAHRIRQSPEGSRRIVLVLQGGGALGAYQAGVYAAMHEAGVEPDWIIGTSIGAINASLIAGNHVGDRVPRLREFWRRMEHADPWGMASVLPALSDKVSYLNTVMNGVSGFFEPNASAFWGRGVRLGAEHAGYYSTAPLQRTLHEMVDFSLVSRCKPRLTVGAAEVRTGKMCYFDSRDGDIGVEHVLASGALPPAFPAVRINGELYWDGGILSNTPVEQVFEEDPHSNSLVFAVHLWSPDGLEPETINDVTHRLKDIQYSSKIASHIEKQREVHRLSHIISKLVEQLPENLRDSPAVHELSAYGCLSRMHVVRLLAPRLDMENHTKDTDFSRSGIKMRWDAGYADTCRALRRAPWEGTFDPLERTILHEPMDYMAIADLIPDVILDERPPR